MEQSPAKVTTSSPSQEIPYISWIPKVYHGHKSLVLIPVLSQMNLGHTPQHIALWFILILCSYLHPDLPSGLFLFRCPHKNHVCILFTLLYSVSVVDSLLSYMVNANEVSSLSAIFLLCCINFCLYKLSSFLINCPTFPAHSAHCTPLYGNAGIIWTKSQNMDDQYMTQNMADCPFLHNITVFTFEVIPYWLYDVTIVLTPCTFLKHTVLLYEL